MTDPEGTAAAESLLERLPDGWAMADTGRGARGWAGVRATGAPSDSVGSHAWFYAHSDGDLWTAVWMEPKGARCGRHGRVARVTGVRERCVEWIVEKALEFETRAGD